MMPALSAPERIVIVGGGAGGLELAAQLGRAYGPERVLLVDSRPFHIWKPSLHEVAAGTLDIHQEGLSYLMLARLAGFSFAQGELTSVDRAARRIRIGAVRDPRGQEILGPRELSYGNLVLAVGSASNFFNTPGAAQYAVTLDNTENAEAFRLTILKAMAQVDQDKLRNPSARLDLVIVGGGATGVELAVELTEASHVVSTYGLPNFRVERDMAITLVEGAPRILSALPEKISRAATARLTELGIRVETHCRVAEVSPDSVKTADGRSFAASLCLWAAGIRGPDLLAQLGLPLNKAGQLIVNERLETEDPYVLALGDCCAAPWHGERIVPARAQTAHQEASYLARKLGARLAGKDEPQQAYVYRDYGSLVSLGQGAGVGSLMGKLAGRGLFVSGTLARLMYMSLHLMHHRAVLGVSRTATMALARLLMRRTHPRVKLH
ncbi:NAD(P)/FAD-dependent oxidoreductase [Bordetella holmesii]|nr:NAD(P)/FAD-dependent oxidoreductase [Bordetella holmesii]AHV91829.1 pyridine nucleotide-disulfide oxidoreductase family protein [Bordetella holmesii ATCC 51541]EWM45629.1 pyridine nucleotide-disulfide oxidoreductase family protein [Bordetella holmesii 70147]AMD50158.1 NADH dehydrogenase [Bordetella holmesii F627]MBO1241170.1 NAD(P)/FAD-dependent oxidoreductase [Bordetella holmesii]MBO1242217.1 NAD(P)/FAD-dependent oxidoreductase [Bordetella holmesii]